MDEQKNKSEPNHQEIPETWKNIIITDKSSMADILRAFFAKVLTEGSMLVTLEKGLVEWVDGQVKTQKYRSRSHLIEVALLRMKDKNRLP